jgi:C4-type Zn-finger protein
MRPAVFCSYGVLVHVFNGCFLMEVDCPECGGEGRCEYEEAVVDWDHGGYLKGVVKTCEKCNGYGAVEVEDE